jgi:SAM-dependent methyltransferase
MVSTQKLPPTPRLGPPRAFDRERFREEFERVVVGGPFQETADYYPRYRSRYEHILATYAAIAPDAPLDVCEIGGGQHALLASRLWGDRAVVGDLFGPHHAHLESQGVRTLRWDLAVDEPPFEAAFDRLLLCEVIAHVAVPPHVYLEKLRKTLRPGGRIIVTTPNLHRLRNLAHLATGRDPWGYFARTSGDHFFGMYLDFSADHLTWQLTTAGFRDVDVSLVEYPHKATTALGRVGNALGRPLHRIPRFRGGLVAVATA